MLSKVAVRISRNVEKIVWWRTRIIVNAPGRYKASLSVFDMVKSVVYEMGYTTSYNCKGEDPATPFLPPCHLL